MAEEKEITNNVPQPIPPVQDGVNQTPIANEPNFNIPNYPKPQEFDTIADSIIQGVQNEAPTIDEATRASLEAASLDINKVLPQIGGYQKYTTPGPSGQGFNPWEANTNNFNLNTVEGRRAFMAGSSQRAEQNFQDTGRGTPSSGAWQDPIVFGMRSMNADRYWNHPKFQELGYHPFQDNESYYNTNSSWSDDLSRSRGAWSTMFGPAFTSNWRAIRDFFHGDNLAMDYEGSNAMADAMRIGSSSRGGVGGFVNDLFINSAYTGGIITSMFVEEVALSMGTVLTGGATSGIQALRTAGHAKTLFNLGDKISDASRTVGNYSTDFIKKIGDIDYARKFYNWSKGSTFTPRSARWLASQLAPETSYAMSKINSTRNTVENMGNLAKTGKMFGGFYRDARALSLAWSESKLEGGLEELEKREEYYLEMLEKNNGNPLSQQQWQALDYLSKGAGLSTAWKNLPIIWLSNKFVLDGALRGFKPLGRMLDETMEGAGGRILRGEVSGKQMWFDAGTGLKGVWNAGFKGNAKLFGAAALRYSTANFAEGFQELAQEGVAAGTGRYYDGLFHEALSTSIDLDIAAVESARKTNTYEDVMKGISAGFQGESVNFHTFMSGFLMGGMVQPFQAVLFKHMPNLYKKVSDPKKFKAYQVAKDTYIENAVSTLNELWSSPTKYFDITKLDALNQRSLNQEMLKASYLNDIMAFKDAKDQSIFSKLYTMIKLGKGAQFSDHIKNFLNMSDEELLQAFPEADASAKDIRKRFEGMDVKLLDMQNKYHKLNEKYVNPFDKEKYEFGSRAYAQEAIRSLAYDHAKMMLMFTNNTYERTVERMNSMYEKLSIDPVVDKMAANDINALLTREGMMKEIRILEDELEVAPGKTAKKEYKEIYKQKQEKLKLLKSYKDVLTNDKNKNKDGTFKKSKSPLLKKAFLNYINHIKNTSDGKLVDNDGINQAIEMIVDHKILNGRLSDYDRARRILDNPDHLVEVADRVAIAMNRIWEANRKEYKIYKDTKDFINNQERSKVLTDLAKEGIFADSDQALIYLKSGVVPDIWYSEDSRLTPMTAFENPNAWRTKEKVLRNHTKIKEEEAKSDAVEKQKIKNQTEGDQGDITDKEVKDVKKGKNNTERSVFQEFLSTDPNTEKILLKQYEQYEEIYDQLITKPPFYEFNEWIQRGDGGAPVLRARMKLYNLWNAQNAKAKAKQSFELWLSQNQGRADVNNIITNTKAANGESLIATDLMYNSVMNEESTLQHKLDAEETSLYTLKDAGISVIRVDVFDEDTQTKSKYFRIITLNGKDAYDIYEDLDKTGEVIKKTYNRKADVDQAAQFIKDNKIKGDTFKFEIAPGEFQELTTKQHVYKDGKKYIVQSRKALVEEHGNLFVTPKEGGDPEKITAGEFTANGWSIGETSQERKSKPVQLVSSTEDVNSLTRLRVNEPIAFYKYISDEQDAQGYTSEEAILDFEETLKGLTPEDRKNLTLKITKGENFEAVIENAPEDLTKMKDFPQFYNKQEDEFYKANTQLKRGASKFNVTLMLNDQPIARMSSFHDAVLLDQNGEKIDPLTITADQAKRLFRTKGFGRDAHVTIQNNYAYSLMIEKKFDELLKGKDVVDIKVEDLKDDSIHLLLDPGRPAYGNRKKNKLFTKIDDLDYWSVGEYKGQKIFYVVNQQRRSGKSAKVESPPITNHPQETNEDIAALENLRDQVDAIMGDQGKTSFDYKLRMGRYIMFVKTPNGTMTAIELKSPPLTDAKLNEVFTDLKTKSAEIADNHITNENKSNESYTDQAEEIAYNFSDQLAAELFIASETEGQNISIELQPYGGVIISDYNTTTKKQRHITISRAKMKKIADLNEFIEFTNKKWSEDHGDKNKIELKKEYLRKNIPNNISVENFKSDMTGNIQPHIRYGLGLNLEYTGDIEAMKEAHAQAKKDKELKKENDGAVETTTTDKKDVVELNRETFKAIAGSNFRRVPENIIRSIAQKIVNKEELTPQEQAIVNSPQQSGRIQAERMSIMNVQNSPQAEKRVKASDVLKSKTRKNEKAQTDKLKKEADKAWEEAFAKGLIEFNGDKKLASEKADNDKKYISLMAQYKEARENLPGMKILDNLDNFDEEDVQKIEDFVEWAKQNLPDFIQIESIEDLGERLKNSGMTVGAFLMHLKNSALGVKGGFVGKIYVGKKTPYRYHEAFHAVFRMMLTDEQINKFLGLAKKDVNKLLRSNKGYEMIPGFFAKTKKQALDKLRTMSPVYENMNDNKLEDVLYEEYLADQFEIFKENPTKSKIDSQVKSFFTVLLEFIMSIFTKMDSKNNTQEDPMHELFRDIDSAKYKTANVQINRFTEASAKLSGGITTPAYKLLTKDEIEVPVQIRRAGELITVKKKIKQTFTSDESDLLVRNSVSAYWDLRAKLKIDQRKKDIAYKAKKAAEKNLIHEAVNLVIQYHDPNSAGWDNLDMKTEAGRKEYKQQKDKYEALLAYRKDFRDAVRSYLDLVQKQDQDMIDDYDLADSAEVKSTEDWDEEANQRGGYRNLPTQLRMFIATTVIAEQDKHGNPIYLNPNAPKNKRIQLKAGVDYIQAYNGLLKSVSGTLDEIDMLKKMYLFSRTNNHSRAVINKFFNKIFGKNGMQVVEQTVLENGQLPAQSQIADPEFLNMMFNGFYQFRVDYIFALRDKKTGETSLFAANHKDDAHHQTTKWNASHQTKIKALRNRKSMMKGGALRKLNNYVINPLTNDLRSTESPKSFEALENTSRRYAEQLEELTGISLSANYIAYSILQTKDPSDPNLIALKTAYTEQGITYEDLEELSISLQKGEEIFYDHQEIDNPDKVNENDGNETVPDTEVVEGGIKGRLKKWALGNAIFDETVGSTVFLDPKGNFIYAHQLPTYHLEKVAMINSAEGIKMEKDANPDYVKNYLLNDPAFTSLAENQQLKVLRMIGFKETTTSITADGTRVENKGLDANAMPGKSYGELTDAEQQANLINMYLLNVSQRSGKIKQENFYTEQKGRRKSTIEFATSPVMIRVIEASNTADWVNLSVIKAVELDKKSGEIKLTDKLVNGFLDKVEKEFNLISDESAKLSDPEWMEKEDVYDGYHTDKNGNIANSIEQIEEHEKNNKKNQHQQYRAYKFTENESVLVIRKPKEKIDGLTNDNVRGTLGNTEYGRIETGNQKVFIKDNLISGLQAGKRGEVIIGDTIYMVDHLGRKNRTQYDLLKAIQQGEFGNAVSTEATDKHSKNNKITLSDPEGGSYEFYTESAKLAKFFNNPKIDKNIYRIIPREDYLNELKEKGQVMSLQKGTVDMSLKQELERLARQGDISFAQALDRLNTLREEQGLNSVRDTVKEALKSQYDLYNNAINRIGVMDRLDARLKYGITADSAKKKGYAKSGKNKATRHTSKLMNLTDDVDYNLQQIFFSNWLNTSSLNEILLGNESISLKDGVDKIKRAKMQNAAGPNARSVVTKPEWGINNITTHVDGIIIEDPEFTKTYDGSNKGHQQTDAQVYMTINAFKQTWFGLGKLNKQQAELIQKVTKGQPITAEEFFGAVDKNSLGYKQFDAQLNSKKYVYGDGMKYVKMSVFILTPEFDSHKDGKPLESRIKLYNLRKKMEEYEAKNKTIMWAIPKSASKMANKNVIKPEIVFNSDTNYDETFGKGNKNVTRFDARWLRLQQVTPSNKIEIVDPRQIKNLILNEQNDNVTVILEGKEYTVGEIKKLYELSLTHRVELKYLSRRNLIFDIDSALGELTESIASGGITPDLQSFLDYATAALEASQSKSQFVEFFSMENNNAKYELNNPITIQRYTELIMSFFGRGVLAEKQPGHTVTLASDYGIDVIKQVEEVDGDGNPIAWTVVRTDEWKNKSEEERATLSAIKENKDGTFSGLKPKQYYVDRLRHDVTEYKRNKDGKLIKKNGKLVKTKQTFSEFMIPPHFSEMMTDLDLTKPIPDTLAKMFGVRIPSQDKHSAINLKIVDFMPVYYGSTAVFSRELIEVSGADFDIDKLYIQNKEFYVNENGEFKEYGKAKKETDQFADYIRYTLKQFKKKDSTEALALKKWRRRADSADKKTQTDIVKDVNVIEVEFDYWFRTNKANLGLSQADTDTYKEMIRTSARKTYADTEGYEYDELTDKFEPVYKEDTEITDKVSNEELLQYFKENKFIAGALGVLKLPINFNEYKQFKKDNEVKINNDLSFYAEPYAGGYNNQVLDYKFALLGNDHMNKYVTSTASIKNQPADLGPLTEIVEEIENDLPNLAEEFNEDGLDVNNMLGILKAWSNNKAGARNIGAAVLPNIYLGWLRNANIVLREANSNDTPIPILRLNKQDYKKFGVNYEIDPKTGKENKQGYRTQYIISALITAMTDNAKERLAAKLGLNKDALAVVTNMVALGVNIKTAIYLVNYPTIKDSYFKAMNKKSPTDPGIRSLIAGRIQTLEKGEAAELSKKIEVTDGLLREHILDYKNAQETAIINQEPLANEWKAEELAVLKQFMNIWNIKDYTTKLSAIATIQNGMGRDMQSIESKNNDLQTLGLELSDQDFAETNIPFDIRHLVKNPDTIMGVNYLMYKQFTERILPQALVTASAPFKKLHTIIRENFGALPPALADAAIEKSRKDVLTYVNGLAYMNLVAGTSNFTATSLNNSLIYEEMDGPVNIYDVVNKLRDYLKEKGVENKFIEKFIYNDKAYSGENKSALNRITANQWTQLAPSQIIELQDGLLSLFSGNEIEREASNHLVNYLLVKDGFQYKSDSFLNVVPPVMLTTFLQASEAVKELFSQDEPTDTGFENVFGEGITFKVLAEYMTEYFESASTEHFVQNISASDQWGKLVQMAYGVQAEVDTEIYSATINEKVASGRPNALFVIQDTQAQDIVRNNRVRNLPNVITIPTRKSKKEPFTDDEILENKDIITEALDKIRDIVNESGMPLNLDVLGFGVGAGWEMETDAPETFEFLSEQLKTLFAYKQPYFRSEKTKSKDGVTKVISGMQTGVDQLGLEVAKELGIKTGGTAPIGFVTEDGKSKELGKEYGVKEITEDSNKKYGKPEEELYSARTELNIMNSDGTVYFNFGETSPGLQSTKGFAQNVLARKIKDPKDKSKQITRPDKPFILNPTVDQLKEFIKKNNIKTLNVAGNRSSKMTSQQQESVKEILQDALGVDKKGGKKVRVSGSVDKVTEQKYASYLNLQEPGKAVMIVDAMLGTRRDKTKNKVVFSRGYKKKKGETQKQYNARIKKAKANKSQLRRSGRKTKVITVNNQEIDVFTFKTHEKIRVPLVFKDLKDGKIKQHKTKKITILLKRTKLYVPYTAEEIPQAGDSFNLDNPESTVWGTRAEYKQVLSRGSKQQNGMAFIFDPVNGGVVIRRPAYDALREAQKAAEVVDDKTGAGGSNAVLEGQAEMVANKIVKSGIKGNINNTNINQVNSNNDNIELIAGNTKVGDTKDNYIGSIIKKNLIGKDKGQGAVGSNLFKKQSRVQDTKAKITKKDLIEKNENPNKNYSNLRQYLEQLGGPRRFKLASMMGFPDGNISTFENDLNKSSYTQEEYLEDLKKCYK